MADVSSWPPRQFLLLIITKMQMSGTSSSSYRIFEDRISPLVDAFFKVVIMPRFGIWPELGTTPVYGSQRGDGYFPIVASIAFSISGRLMFPGCSNGDCFVWDTLVAKVALNLGSPHDSHEQWLPVWVYHRRSALCTGSWDKNLKGCAWRSYKILDVCTVA
ncbi:hypothetical protein Syun_021670 [Stephania yunnanensis]|uniref:Uncharacterized protein n=1 Tax=Stephania yunnanensis TaxID=152371 RepID=A0AAP0IH17_9MAGN